MKRIPSCFVLAATVGTTCAPGALADAQTSAHPSPLQPVAPAETVKTDTPPPVADSPDPAAADEDEDWLPGEFSGDLFFVSDYVDRGLSNTDSKPAVQGGLYYSWNVGVEGVDPYVGIWGSNVDFDDGGEATVELDALFGISGTVGNLEWDIGGSYYAYPGADKDLHYNYWEVPVALTYTVIDRVSLIGQYFYSPNFFGDSGQGHYLAGGLSYDLPVGPVVVTLTAITGHQWIEDNQAFGVADYQDWQFGVTVGYKNLEVAATYTDTNINKDNCFGGTDFCEARAVLSIGLQF